eukprot:14626_5
MGSCCTGAICGGDSKGPASWCCYRYLPKRIKTGRSECSLHVLSTNGGDGFCAATFKRNNSSAPVWNMTHDIQRDRHPPSMCIRFAFSPPFIAQVVCMVVVR